MGKLQESFRASSAGRWYYGREPQEQRIVAALAAALALTLVWLGLWKPIQDWKLESQNRHENAVANLEWLKLNESRLKTLPGPGEDAGKNLLRTITESARDGGLKLSRIQPDGEGGINVVLQDQPFNAVLALLSQLAENNAVVVTRASIDESGNPGRINAQVRFE